MPNDYTDLLADAAEAAGLAPRAIVCPEDREVDLNGIRFHYLDWGNDHLPHVVLLHGGSLTAHTWDLAALLLRDHYHLVALDQRGHGDSGWTPEERLGEDGMLNVDAIAETFWSLHVQHRSAWTHEIDLRPFKETW